MDSYTRTVIEMAIIEVWAVCMHQKNLTGYKLEGHPFEAQQAAIALARLGRLLLDDQEKAEEFAAGKLLEFSEHEKARQA